MKKIRYGNELDPLYSRWLSMTQRCSNPKHRSYPRYGGRGITVDESFKDFTTYKHYVESLPGFNPGNATIDRVENDGNYEPGNLRWADQSTQSANQSSEAKGRNTYTGVNWSSTHNRWIARVNVGGKCVFSKVCTSEYDAWLERSNYIKTHGLPHIIQDFIY